MQLRSPRAFVVALLLLACRDAEVIAPEPNRASTAPLWLGRGSAGITVDGVTELGQLGGAVPEMVALSADGKVAVGNIFINLPNGDNVSHAVRWTATEGLLDLGVGTVLDASADGSVVVGWTHSGDFDARAVVWTVSGGVPHATILAPVQGEASAVSADGSTVVGYYAVGLGLRAFRWTTGGGLQNLGALEEGGFGTFPQDVSDDGNTVVGAAGTSAGVRAFRWTPGTGMHDLGMPHRAEARRVSANGAVIVGIVYPPGEERVFRWVAGQTQVLEGLGGCCEGFTAMSPDANTIVGIANLASGGSRGFVWSLAAGTRELGTFGGAISNAYDVSADGTLIVGSAVDNNFSHRPVYWTTSSQPRELVVPHDPLREGFAQRISADGKVVYGMVWTLTNRFATLLWSVRDEGDTPLGSEVVVTPVDPTTGATPVTLSFGSVTTGGTTTVTTTAQGTPPATGFRLGNPPVYYEINTTADFTGGVTLCITYDETHFQNEGQLKLLHRNANGDWVDVTTSLNTQTNSICGVTADFSPFLVAEANRAPMVTSVQFPTNPIAVNEGVAVSASFTDADVGDTHGDGTTISWGDGTTSSGSQLTVDQAAGTIAGAHAYGAPGVYTVTVTVADPYGGTSTMLAQYVVAYDPTGGFVTGGGWIDSPPGALIADASLTGRANFGFVSRYQKGATIPTGNTEFQFKVANLQFRSISYDWLVVAGSQAKFKGVGTVNGVGSYGFMLTASDGNLSGGGDGFRIKIWQIGTGTVVYDNKMGTRDDAADVTLLGGGSVVIHK